MFWGQEEKDKFNSTFLSCPRREGTPGIQRQQYRSSMILAQIRWNTLNGRYLFRDYKQAHATHTIQNRLFFQRLLTSSDCGSSFNLTQERRFKIFLTRNCGWCRQLQTLLWCCVSQRSISHKHPLSARNTTTDSYWRPCQSGFCLGWIGPWVRCPSRAPRGDRVVLRRCTLSFFTGGGGAPHASGKRHTGARSATTQQERHAICTAKSLFQTWQKMDLSFPMNKQLETVVSRTKPSVSLILGETLPLWSCMHRPQ